MDATAARALAASDIDAGQLEEWLAVRVEGFSGPLVVTRFPGGNSNPTFRLDTPERSYVLRRKPAGTLLPGAHAVEREFRVLRALAGTRLPVPVVHALCEDHAVIGSSFFVMDMVPGRIFWEAPLQEASRDERGACFDAMNATLATLHTLDPATLGLADFGKPQGYLRRQIARWTRQYREDQDAGQVPALDRLADWLAANIPADEECSIVHGDFRCNNLIFDVAGADVRALIDWELATLGDPRVDFAYHLMMYYVPPHIKGGGLRGLDLAAYGIPTEADYIAAYCRRMGRDEIPNLHFYVIYNLFRFAAIIHGIKARMIRGNASSGEAAAIAAELEEFSVLAWGEAVSSCAG